jgi:hypothetical protein
MRRYNVEYHDGEGLKGKTVITSNGEVTAEDAQIVLSAQSEDNHLNSDIVIDNFQENTSIVSQVLGFFGL